MGKGNSYTAKIFSFLLLGSLILLTTMLLHGVEARQLSGSRLVGDASRFKLGGRLHDLRVEGEVLHSGPSPGVGHRYKTLHGTGDVKNSGPSPAEGHKDVTGENH
ncbi:hypothetical protein K2173_009207 [Erythroxylum novogranatense]|uniref:Uncharacterized protein n=1 Tax=Erythroxylum novogranatense TaxID=1862640 RepID=A0AAV8TLP9_9ROSI|nr:hypothetical protein K2173_009207 [Erythroxylum novogranatense]